MEFILAAGVTITGLVLIGFVLFILEPKKRRWDFPYLAGGLISGVLLAFLVVKLFGYFQSLTDQEQATWLFAFLGAGALIFGFGGVYVANHDKKRRM